MATFLFSLLLAAIFVTIATIKLIKTPNLYSWAIVIINLEEEIVKKKFLFFSLMGGGGGKIAR